MLKLSESIFLINLLQSVSKAKIEFSKWLNVNQMLKNAKDGRRIETISLGARLKSLNLLNTFSLDWSKP